MPGCLREILAIVKIQDHCMHKQNAEILPFEINLKCDMIQEMVLLSQVPI